MGGAVKEEKVPFTAQVSNLITPEGRPPSKKEVKGEREKPFYRQV